MADEAGADEEGPGETSEAEMGTGGDKLDLAVGDDLGEEVPGSCENAGALPSNQGCEFWAVDLPNVSTVPPFSLEVVPHDQQFAVVVTNPSLAEPATVEVFLADGDAVMASVTVASETMAVIELPALSIAAGVTSAAGQAYRVVSDTPIIAYQFQPLDNVSPVYSNDATLLFPTHVLSGDYTAITADATLVADDGFSISDLNTGAFVAVVGTEVDTTVSIYPVGALHPGAYQDVVLQPGQVLTAISSERGAPTWGNLSGSRVVADKAVAVFSGSVSTSEPSAEGVCCADHVEHQMLPLTAWGTRYVAAPAASAVGEGNDASLYRVTGAFDDTLLVWEPGPPPGAPMTIDAEETVAFVATTAFTVRAFDDSQSFALTQFLLSNQYFPDLFGRPGDPSMILLPAAGQYQDKYVFLTPDGYASNVVTIVRPVGAVMSLDGVPLVNASFTALAGLEGLDYEYAHVAVTPGSHSIEANVDFGVIVSGHANDVSYGYAGGSGVAVISEPPPPPVG